MLPPGTIQMYSHLHVYYFNREYEIHLCIDIIIIHSGMCTCELVKKVGEALGYCHEIFGPQR